MFKVRKIAGIFVLVALLAAYMRSSESTKRYVKHLLKQVPYLPYRYFI